MSPILINGRELGVEHNGIFTAANTDPIPGGRLWPAAALTWRAMRIAAYADGVPLEDFMPAGPASTARTYGQQKVLRIQWCAKGHCEKAAWPGTSNHGWAIAVDVKTTVAAAWLLRHAHEFGWSHDEGARVGEWWHFRYVGATRAQRRKARRVLDPFWVLTPAERRKAKRYKALLAKRKRQGGHLRSRRDRRRRAALRHALIVERKRIWRASQTHGWDGHRRRLRYHALLSLTR